MLANPRKNSGVFESPRERITEFIQLYAATAIVPPQAILMYPAETGKRCSGVLKSLRTGSVSNTEIILTANPKTAVTAAELNIAVFNCLYFFEPKY